MNKIRRKNLQSIIDQLEELKSSLEDLQAEEEEYRDNIPENMQESERYEKADEACDNRCRGQSGRSHQQHRSCYRVKGEKPYDDQNVGIHSRALD